MAEVTIAHVPSGNGALFPFGVIAAPFESASVQGIEGQPRWQVFKLGEGLRGWGRHNRAAPEMRATVSQTSSMLECLHVNISTWGRAGRCVHRLCWKLRMCGGGWTNRSAHVCVCILHGCQPWLVCVRILHGSDPLLVCVCIQHGCEPLLVCLRGMAWAGRPSIVILLPQAVSPGGVGHPV